MSVPPSCMRMRWGARRNPRRGRIAHRRPARGDLVDVPGASRAFRGGLVVYATDLKASWPGCRRELLARAAG